MDLLQSLNIEDLPEQQTITRHLTELHPDFVLRLGFDACATCGEALSSSVPCRACRRILYCSDHCRTQDATVTATASASSKVYPHKLLDEEDYDDDEPDAALGHTSIVCALLNLCNDDEDVERIGEKESSSMTAARREAAVDRVRSEYESYPATLANVLLSSSSSSNNDNTDTDTNGSPSCYQTALQQCRDRRHCTIYIVGASAEAELHRPGEEGDDIKGHSNSKSPSSLASDYADALAELADQYRLSTVALVFIGPECPTQPIHEAAPMMVSSAEQPQQQQHQVGTVTLRSFQAILNAPTLQTIQEEISGPNGNPDHDHRRPDLVVFFNPGFTCPDYAFWKETLRCIPSGTPFLSATNTEMEGMADCQFLLDQDKMQSLPAGLADIFDVHSRRDDEDVQGDSAQYSSSSSDNGSFFAVNPFSGSRVRQNGTMANDLFVKNRWILGGILASFDPSAAALGESHDTHKRIRGDGPTTAANSKSSNPALI